MLLMNNKMDCIVKLSRGTSTFALEQEDNPLKWCLNMATKFCPHCGEKNGFQVNFNIVCRIGDKEEKGYLRTCKDCGGRFITIQKDERILEAKKSN